MNLFHQSLAWVVKTKFRHFAAWTAGIIFVGFLFISSIETMIKTAESNVESVRINASISLERCAAIEEECGLKAKAESDFAAANGLNYNASNLLICVWNTRKATGVVCEPRKINSWPEVYGTHFLSSDTLLVLLFLWSVPFLTFASLKLVANEKNKGWVRISVVSVLCVSVFSAFNLWSYYSEEKFFVRWFVFSLAALVFPIALKNVFFWIRSGFNEGKVAVTMNVPVTQVSAAFKEEASINYCDTSVSQAVEKKLLRAGFWDRFFARCIDLPIAIFIVAVVSIFIPEFPEDGQFKPLWIILNLGVGMVTLCITMILWDAFWISKYGATPGKMLLGLIVRDKNGDMPSWKTAKTRATTFLGQGLYYTFFFPVFQIIGAISAWKRRDGVQPWDGVLGTQVLQSPIGGLQRLGVRIFAVLLIVSTVFVMQVLKQVYKQEMRDQILQPYVK